MQSKLISLKPDAQNCAVSVFRGKLKSSSDTWRRSAIEQVSGESGTTCIRRSRIEWRLDVTLLCLMHLVAVQVARCAAANKALLLIARRIRSAKCEPTHRDFFRRLPRKMHPLSVRCVLTRESGNRRDYTFFRLKTTLRR